MEVLTIILAGGVSIRFGNLGKLMPKAMLPVSGDQTLLSRNLDHLYEAGFKNIVVSTSPQNYKILKLFIDRYKAINNRETLDSYHLELISNKNHKISSLSALCEILTQRKACKYVMCFADIYFYTNPYLLLPHHANVAETSNWLGVSKNPKGNIMGKEGLVLVKNNLCRKLFLKLPDQSRYGARQLLNWSGITLFNESVTADLIEFNNKIGSSIEEDFINFCINKGRHFFTYNIDQFINVNSYQDYLKVLE